MSQVNTQRNGSAAPVMAQASDADPPRAPMLRLALAQMNLRVGDLAGNVDALCRWTERARDEGAELVLTPELSICGYPPEDLLLKDGFLHDCRKALEEFARSTSGVVACVGFPEFDGDLYNAMAVIADGAVRAVYRKNRLPNYAVFDERRYFSAGRDSGLVDVGGARVGLSICEDIWVDGPPLSDAAAAGAELILNASASPYHRGKGIERERMLAQRARDHMSAVAFCNLVGGQDELIFDGHSVVMDQRGVMLARAPQFEEALLHVTIDIEGVRSERLHHPRPRGDLGRTPGLGARVPSTPVTRSRTSPSPMSVAPVVTPVLDDLAEVYASLVLGLRDYVLKNGFKHVCLGVSGGVDSALVLLVAVDALGAGQVDALLMPSRYSSLETRADARVLCENLGVRSHEISIEPAFEAYERMLAPVLPGPRPDVTAQHLQARIRGTVLMAMQNTFGWLALTTNNKTETSVGYSTLYGDTAGSLAVINDVPKLLVYALIQHRRTSRSEDPVPPGIVERAPSAETAPEQRDEDTLPKFATLDRILELAIDEDASRERILALTGASTVDVDLTLGLIAEKEFKRHQQPPGLRISQRAFGRDRRMPITNLYPG